LKSVVPTSSASTASVRTRVECETKRSSHADSAVWKMSNAKRRCHGVTLVTKPGGPKPCPPSSVKPNVGRVGAWPVTLGSTSQSQTGKFERVPPSTIMLVRPCSSCSSTGSKKYGIDMLIRAARAIGNSSGSICLPVVGSR